ncbi:hypothetical protein AB0G55_20945 [Streptomyces toyocaensis]|uniref:hypothetical protein n=1 Tax=Streptomyces toyocaensis TaxID=55952 RepID=UPI000A755883|nr:hypothetical protein [Streptomyces toyocaensis]
MLYETYAAEEICSVSIEELDLTGYQRELHRSVWKAAVHGAVESAAPQGTSRETR